MVLKLSRAAIALAMLSAQALGAQGVGAGRGMLGGAGGGRAAGPLLFGFALECERCERVSGRGFGRGGGGNGLPAARAAWRYTEYPRVVEVMEGGPAERAGIRVGDVLLDIDGRSILSDAGAERFAEVVAGDSVRLTLERGATTLDVAMQIGREFGRGRGRGVGGRVGQPLNPPSSSAENPTFATRVNNIAVDVWSDAPVTASTDSTGATILRAGKTTIRLRPALGRGRGRG